MSIVSQHVASEGAGGSARWAVIASWAIRRAKALGTSITRRKDIEELGRLDERMLADMGLTRGDVQAAAQWSLWGDPTERLAQASRDRRSRRPRL